MINVCWHMVKNINKDPCAICGFADWYRQCKLGSKYLRLVITLYLE